MRQTKILDRLLDADAQASCGDPGVEKPARYAGRFGFETFEVRIGELGFGDVYDLAASVVDDAEIPSRESSAC